MLQLKILISKFSSVIINSCLCIKYISCLIPVDCLDIRYIFSYDCQSFFFHFLILQQNILIGFCPFKLPFYGIFSHIYLGFSNVHTCHCKTFCKCSVNHKTAFWILMQFINILAQMNAIEKIVGISSSIFIRNIKHLSSRFRSYLCLWQLIGDYNLYIS